MDSENLFQNRKTLNYSKMSNDFSLEQIKENLFYVCTVVPGLRMRRIGQKDKTGETMVLRKQRTLVEWGTKEQRESFYRGKFYPIVWSLLTWVER